MKGLRNRDSHSFNIHLKSVHFMLVGPLTCHQAGLYIKQNLKLFVAYMCLILVKDKASNAVFIHHINQPLKHRPLSTAGKEFEDSSTDRL